MKNSPQDILQTYWGYDCFRPLQEEIIASVLDGEDTLALLPTGGGKSICFQVSGLALGGLTVVVSPLIALMKDQVEQLLRRKIPATFLSSVLSPQEICRRMEGLRRGEYKFVYLAPERLQQKSFLQEISKFSISLIAVDEAHCISQWGYDFRPSYLKIARLREHIPNVPVLVLTATATQRVQEDILEKLNMREARRFSQSFERTNLTYAVLYEENKLAKLTELFQKIAGSAIVYVRTRRQAQALATYLSEKNIPSEFYHAGLSFSERNGAQRRWVENQTRVIVATNAFGMGIDKPDVRLVVHYQLPADMESYYQEAGRAGRDGKPSYAIVLHAPPDAMLLRKSIAQEELDKEVIEIVYKKLWEEGVQETNVEFIPTQLPWRLEHWSETSCYSGRLVWEALQLLQKEGILEFNVSKKSQASVQVVVRAEELYKWKQSMGETGLHLDQLLREWGWEVYTREVFFDEGTLSQKIGCSVEMLMDFLLTMERAELIDYKPGNPNPHLVLLHGSEHLKTHPIDWKKYKELRKQKTQRLEYMLEYVSEIDVCRNQKILEYFGERKKELCGKCDVCRGRYLRTISTDQSYKLEKQFVELVGEQEWAYPDLLQAVPFKNPSHKREVLRKLLLDGSLVLTPDRKVRRG